MICTECGNKMVHDNGPIEADYRGEKFQVYGVPHSVCPECGEVSFCGEEMDAYSEAVDAGYRMLKGLLSPRAIKAIRKEYGLTQKELQKVLGVSDPTVSRWETGAAMQGVQSDRMLRLMKEVPEAGRFLMTLGGVPPKDENVAGYSAAWLQQLDEAAMEGLKWEMSA